jgi:hypothetical protein
MHARARTLVSIFALLLTGMLATVGPTAAAAEPYDETFCDVFTDEPGDEHAYCATTRGVLQATMSPSGTASYTENDRLTYEFYTNGQLVETGERKYHFTTVAKDAQVQVARMNGSTEWTTDGVTCRFTFNSIYANSSVRHQIETLGCSPA